MPPSPHPQPMQVTQPGTPEGPPPPTPKDYSDEDSDYERLEIDCVTAMQLGTYIARAFYPRLYVGTRFKPFAVSDPLMEVVQRVFPTHSEEIVMDAIGGIMLNLGHGMVKRRRKQ